MRDVINPPFAPVLMEATRAIGYSVEAAVADIIDNSIAAKASKVEVSFFPVDDVYVCILDDGKGMNDAEINAAMQYGSKSPSDAREATDLGRFGLGLKTASLSQCRVLSVVSKQGDNIVARRWDLDHVVQTGNWSLNILDEEDLTSLPCIDELRNREHGTLVVWQNLDRLLIGETNVVNALGKKMDAVRLHLQLVFHRYMAGETGIKRIAVYFNGNKLEPTDPFLMKKSTQVMDIETLVIRDKKVLVRPFILPHISKLTPDEIAQLGGQDGLRKQQGFYIYRNKRLLIWGTWFKMLRQGDLSKLARIMVDIPNDLDDLWTLDIKKSHAIPPAEVRKNLQSIIETVAEKSKRTWSFRGKKEVDDRLVHVWQRLKTRTGGFSYVINRNHPLVSQVCGDDQEGQRRLDMLLQYIERALPLNQLYIDLNSEEKLDENTEISEAEVRVLLEFLLSNLRSSQERLSFLERQGHTEPFCIFPDLLQELKEREELP